jgi:hypothetical protein
VRKIQRHAVLLLLAGWAFGCAEAATPAPDVGDGGGFVRHPMGAGDGGDFDDVRAPSDLVLADLVPALDVGPGSTMMDAAPGLVCTAAADLAYVERQRPTCEELGAAVDGVDPVECAPTATTGERAGLRCLAFAGWIGRPTAQRCRVAGQWQVHSCAECYVCGDRAVAP